VKMKFKARYAVIILIAIVVIIVVSTCFVTIDAGEIGYRLTLGQISATDLQPGLHMRFPFTQKIIRVDVRERVYHVIAPSFTQDMQTADIEVIVNYAIESASIRSLVENIGIDQIESKLIVPQVNEVLKNAIGKYKAEGLVANRSTVSDLVKTELSSTLIASGIRVTGFSLANIDFSDTFEATIEAKVQAEQEALRAANVTKQKEEENLQAVNAAKAAAEQVKLEADAEAYAIKARAESEAEAIELIQEQLAKDPLYIEYVKALAWDGKLPTTQLSPSTSVIMDLPSFDSTATENNG